MFAVLFEPRHRDIFNMSKLEIGLAYLVVRPAPAGEWNGLTMLRTGEPLLPATGVYVNRPYYPDLLPEQVSKKLRLME